MGEVDQWLRELGVTRQFSAPYSPQQNGRVERWHGTMGDGLRVLLTDSGLPVSFWGEALRQVVWVKNRVLHRALPGGMSPFEAWHGYRPDLSMVYVFGCMATATLTPQAAGAGETAQEGQASGTPGGGHTGQGLEGP